MTLSTVKALATAGLVKMNDNKTEPVQQSEKLGYTFYCHLNVNEYVSIIARGCHFELHNLASILYLLSFMSGSDYCYCS